MWLFLKLAIWGLLIEVCYFLGFDYWGLLIFGLANWRLVILELAIWGSLFEVCLFLGLLISPQIFRFDSGVNSSYISRNPNKLKITDLRSLAFRQRFSL